MNARAQRLFAWCGPVFMAILTLGLWVFARCVPPPSPSRTTTQIAHFFQHDTNMLRAGFQVSMVGAALFLPLVVVIFLQMRRMGGGSAPWAYLQLAAGAAGFFVLIVPIMILQAAAFRPTDIAPDTLRSLDDIAWIIFVSTFSPACVQTLAIGVGILQDTRARPIFPRWAGYFNIWAALLFVPAVGVPFFKTGPLAWNGIFTWWIPLVVFGLWVCVMSLLVLRAVATEAEDESRQTDSAAVPQVAK
jgi:hypothetical protein